MFAVGQVTQDQLTSADRNTRDFEPSFRVRDHAEARAPDRDHCIRDRRTPVRIDDDAGDDPRLLGVDRPRKGHGEDEEEESSDAWNPQRTILNTRSANVSVIGTPTARTICPATREASECWFSPCT